MNNDPIETLAKMWILCDPDKGPYGPPGSGDHPDDPDETGKPRWHWFIPRAKAALKFLSENGYALNCSIWAHHRALKDKG